MDSLNVYVKITKQDKESIQNFYNEILISDERIYLHNNQDLNPNITYNILHQIIIILSLANLKMMSGVPGKLLIKY